MSAFSATEGVYALAWLLGAAQKHGDLRGTAAGSLSTERVQAAFAFEELAKIGSYLLAPSETQEIQLSLWEAAASRSVSPEFRQACMRAWRAWGGE